MRDLDEEDADEIGPQVRPRLHLPRRQHRLPGERCAGLAMATMDTIKLFGAEPANFLDVGGGHRPRRSPKPSRSCSRTPRSRASWRNIFGGIMRCDTIATGVVAAASETHLSVPLVVRMKGTNEDLGKQILADSGLPIISADSMAEAATKIVAAVRKELLNVHFINKDTKIITQGITGKTGQFHTEKCIEYANGKNCFVAGREPQEGGEKIFDVPIFGSVKEAASRPAPPSPSSTCRRRCRRRHLGSRRGRPRPGHLHHRRHPRPRHADGAQQDEGREARRQRRPCCSARTAPASSPRTK